MPSHRIRCGWVQRIKSKAATQPLTALPHTVSIISNGLRGVIESVCGPVHPGNWPSVAQDTLGSVLKVSRLSVLVSCTDSLTM